MPVLTTIYMARKPLQGTVASNALKYGTGSLNIGATRLGTGDDLNGGAYSEGGRAPLPVDEREGAAAGMFAEGGGRLPGQYQQPKGRWPANVILQHRPSCKLVGQHYEDFLINVYADATKGNFASYKDEDDERPDYKAEGNGQVVDEWECVEGCPVAHLDDQTGTLRTSPMVHTTKGGQGRCYGKENVRHLVVQGSEGGASRYFKQVQGALELREYLRTMASTPDMQAVVVDLDSAEDVIAEWDDQSCCGLVVFGDRPATAAEAAEFDRVLLPGGHIFIVSPAIQPTGHTNAIMLEEAGFEIRDCILWVRESGRFHYVAKAARSEREAGCGHLKGKTGHEAVDRKEGTAGVDNPRAGAGRTAKHVKNHHPTVKAIDIMVRLLHDVPVADRPVLDPFMGSGTTGIACLRTGHSFIGIEREVDFIEIADARVRHWDRAEAGWNGAEIESDHDSREVGEDKVLSLEGLFG